MIKLKYLLFEELHKPLPKVLYHATFNALIPRIQRLGLLPKDDEILHNFEGIESGVYLAESANEAGSFVEVSENPNIPEEWFNDIVVIKVDTTKLDPSKFTVDPNVIAHEDEDFRPFLYKGVIPSAAFIDIVDYY
jgi:hypothetical protein